MLGKYDYQYYIDIKYADLAGVKRPRIYVYLENTNFDEALQRWRETSPERIKLFNSLKEKYKGAWPASVIDELNKFVSIEFDARV